MKMNFCIIYVDFIHTLNCKTVALFSTQVLNVTVRKIDYYSLVQELALRNVNDNGNVEIQELENACHYIKGFHDPYPTSITMQGTPIFLYQIHLIGENGNFMTLLMCAPEHVCIHLYSQVMFLTKSPALLASIPYHPVPFLHFSMTSSPLLKLCTARSRIRQICI